MIEIFCTTKCNWDCYYCCENIHNSKKTPSYEDVILKVKQNLDNPIILSGGEPGLLPENIIKTIFSIHNDISVNTNGTFIKKYKNFVNKATKIYYHCTVDLEPIKNIYDENNIEYLVIITDDNIHKLDNFLKTYNNIYFDVIPCDIPQDIKYYKNLSFENIKLLKQIIKNNKNVYKKSLLYLMNKNRYNIKKFI